MESSSGYAVVRGLLTSAEAQLLAAECDAVIASEGDALHIEDAACAVDLLEKVQLPEQHRARTDPHAYIDARCTVTTASPKDVVSELLFKRLPRAVCQATGWSSAFIFNEHYVVKPANSNIRFRWHTDRNEQLAMCLHKDSQPEYIAAWCCLEPVIGPEHGGLIMLPLHAYGGQDVPPFPDEDEEGDNDDDADEAKTIDTKALLEFQDVLELRQGDVVLFTSRTWHCSGVNRTREPRRAYYAQYSEAPITIDRAPLCLAIPCELCLSTCGKRQADDASEDEDAATRLKAAKLQPTDAAVEPGPQTL